MLAEVNALAAGPLDELMAALDEATHDLKKKAKAVDIAW
jgi:hypothetical protein